MIGWLRAFFDDSACMTAPSARPLTARVIGQLVPMTLCLGAGAVAGGLGVPAGWLCGALIMAAILSSTGQFDAMVPDLRDFALFLSGLSIGLSVTPETVARFATIPLSLSIMVVAVIVITWSSAYALMLLYGWRKLDALLASAPGALSTTLVIAYENQAKVSHVVVVQLFRLFMLMAVLPSVISAGVGGATAALPDAHVLPPLQFAIVCACSLFGSWVLKLVHMPTYFLLGGMIAAGTLTGSGLVDGRMPPLLASISFAMVGWFIGERFRGIKWRDVAALTGPMTVSFAVTGLVALAFSELIVALSHIPQSEAIVAFSPGGVEAMSILALALHLDPVFVASHHIVRFMFIGTCLPIAIKIWPRLFGLGEGQKT
jgi:membrane AbrB-like protein